MKMFVLFMGLVFALFGFPGIFSELYAKPVEARIDEEKLDSLKEDIDSHPKYGEGRFKTKLYMYDVVLRVWKSEPVEDIKLVVYCYGEIEDWDKERNIVLMDRLVKEGITAKPSEINEFKLGPSSFLEGEAVKETATTITKWKIGHDNYAYALEVYVGGKVVDTIFSKSSSKFKELFEKTKNDKPFN